MSADDSVTLPGRLAGDMLRITVGFEEIALYAIKSNPVAYLLKRFVRISFNIAFNKCCNLGHYEDCETKLGVCHVRASFSKLGIPARLCKYGDVAPTWVD